MTHIYYGNRAHFEENADAVKAIAGLGDDYWALFEFDVPGGNIDCLIIRPATETTPDGTPSVLIVTEVKHVSGRLVGLENGKWTIERNGAATAYTASNSADDNPWQQTIRVLNALRAWMSNNQRVFLESGVTHEYADIKLWPTLLIVRTDADEPHGLPYGPTNRFGNFCFSIEDWVRKVTTWTPRVGIQLTIDDVTRLVSALQLTEWTGPEATDAAADATEAEPTPTMASTPSAVEVPNHTPPEPPAHHDEPAVDLEWLDGLMHWARDLERRVQALEARANASAPPRTTADTPVSTNGEGASIATDVLVDTMQEISQQGLSRAFPNVIRLMSARLGYNLKDVNYDGFGTATGMFDAAVRDGIIQYGPMAGPSPSIYLAEEALPDDE